VSRHLLKLKIRKNSDTGDTKTEKLVGNVGGMGNTSNALGKTRRTRKYNIKIDLKQDLRKRIKPHVTDKFLALVFSLSLSLRWHLLLLRLNSHFVLT
jgi:hypothetical protein